VFGKAINAKWMNDFYLFCISICVSAAGDASTLSSTAITN